MKEFLKNVFGITAAVVLIYVGLIGFIAVGAFGAAFLQGAFF